MPAPHNMIGRVLGGYVLQSQIGAGGMGIVYRANDERLGRTVAIKILPKRFRADETLRMRFLLEGRTAARVDHPHVVRILSAGEEEEVPFLVMEFVDGGSLQRLIEKRQKLAPGTALRILRQLAEGLAAAHRVGVLHRDVKPANVLFTREGEPRLVDFGLAREEVSDVQLSQTGMVMGTPHYMAPEVCAGRRGDARSDIYSLGVVAYLLLSFRLPFDGDGAVQILLKHVSDPPPPLPEAPRAVAEVIERAMAKDPDRRWQTAGEFAEALGLLEAHAKGGFAVPPGSGVERSRGGAAVPVRALPSALPPAPGAAPATAAETPTAGVHLPARRRRWVVAVAAGMLALIAVPVAVVAARKTAGDRPAVEPPRALPVAVTDAGGEERTAAHEDSGVADDDLVRATRDAERLERAGDFQGALDLWIHASISTPRGRATAARAMAAIEGRARTRVEETIKDSPRGPRGVLRLRDVARGMPAELARRLEESARAREADWLPEDGIRHLRAAVRFPDLDTPSRHLEKLEASTPASERPTLDLARMMLRHAGETLQSAGEWYRSHAGSETLLELADGSKLAVTLGAVDDQRRSIHVTVEKSAVQVPLHSISIGDFLTRATWGVPSNGALLAAIDAAWLLGTREDFWALAFRAHRRGVALGKAREELLALSIPPDLQAAAQEADRRLDRSWENREAAGVAAREYFGRFAHLPRFQERQAARELLAHARGPASASDLGALLSAKVLGDGNRVTLSYGPGDELLADVDASGTWSVEPSRALRIVPGPGGVRFTLSSLEFSDPSVRLRIAPGTAFSILFASRGPFEHLALTCRRSADGRATLELPLRGETLSAEIPSDGILEIGMTLKGRSLTAHFMELTRTVELPAIWSGGVGLELSGPATLHALQVSGSAEFRTRDLDEELKPLEEAARKQGERKSVRIGRWTPHPTDRDGVVFSSGSGEVALSPPEWGWGSHWAARFTALVMNEAELTLELRTSPDSEVRLSLQPGRSLSSVRSGETWLTTGRIAPILRNRAADFKVQVADDLACLEMNGKVIWSGHVHGASAGGLRFRVRGGVEIRQLDIAELRPARR